MFKGVFAALLTPFDAQGNVIEGRLRDHVEWLIDKGINGLYICGNTGQGLYLSVAERKRIAEVVKDAAGGRCEIIAHIAAPATRDAQELAAHADHIGLDAIASLPPLNAGFKDDEIVAYYRDLSAACRLPCFIYVHGASGAAPLSIETVLRIAEIPGIVGMKYTNPDFFRMQDMRQRLQGNWMVLSGPDELFLPALTMGVQGCIGTTQNIFPELFLEILNCFAVRDLSRAMAIQETVTRIVRLYFIHGGYPTAHAMLAARGFPLNCCRAPFTLRLSDEACAAVRQAIREALAECPLAIELA